MDTSRFLIDVANIIGTRVIAKNLLKTLAPIIMKNVIAKVRVHSFKASIIVSLLNVFPGIVRSIAQKAPIAEACATENQPENMPPSTMPKRSTTPISPVKD